MKEVVIEKLSVSDADYIASATEKGFSDGWNKDMVISAFNGGRFCAFAIKESCGKPCDKPCDKDGARGFIAFSIGMDDADIESVFIEREFRKKGYADKLLSFAEDYIFSLEKEKIFLEVKEDNFAAINLYIKHGFKKISVRKKYYPDGKNALIMLKTKE